MQREIKFRAWNTIHKQIEEVNSIRFSKSQYTQVSTRCFNEKSGKSVDEQSVYGHKDGGDNVILMQYTGLKDKNGKEIYESDVIPYHFNHKIAGVVKYGEYHNPFDSDNHGGHVGFYLEWNEPDSMLRVDLCYWIKVSEVIGNIYDNPELLEVSE